MMKVCFADELFDAQLLRALNGVYYGGADVGECFAAAQRIAEGSPESWHQEWLRTAERIDAGGEASLAGGHVVSAREAFLRASNYYRTAYIFLIGTPVDPRLVQAFDKQTDAFRKAAALFSPPFEPIAIPYVGVLQRYTLMGFAEQISCPTLVCFADHDEIAAYAKQLFDALKCPKQFMTFTRAEGAGEHCESGNRSLLHQRAFDWLDQTPMNNGW